MKRGRAGQVGGVSVAGKGVMGEMLYWRGKVERWRGRERSGEGMQSDGERGKALGGVFW